MRNEATQQPCHPLGELYSPLPLTPKGEPKPANKCLPHRQMRNEATQQPCHPRFYPFGKGTVLAAHLSESRIWRIWRFHGQRISGILTSHISVIQTNEQCHAHIAHMRSLSPAAQVAVLT